MTKLIPIGEIHVSENRQRRTFDEIALQELVESIAERSYGLLHPLVVRPNREGPGFVLVAGERRLRAIQDIYALGRQFFHGGSLVQGGLVPVVDLSELSPLDAFEAELEENIRRKDLTVIEAAQATAQLFELRTQQAARDGAPTPTTADLTREVYDLPKDKPPTELGAYRDTIKSHLIIARHAEDPDVRKATSVKEAVRIVKRKEEARLNAELGAALGASFSSASHQLIKGDCLHHLEGMPPARFDIILTDPPYGMGADEFGNSARPGEYAAHAYDDSYETWAKLMARLPLALGRVARPDAHAYLFCDIDRFHELRRLMSEAGWLVHRTPIIWHNPDGFRAPWPEHGPQRKYELILYARRGEKRCLALKGDVIEARKDAALGHPAQKPVSLLRALLERSARPGDCVLDPFAGSGATIEACDALKLPCTAIELDEGFYGMAAQRLKSLSIQESLL